MALERGQVAWALAKAEEWVWVLVKAVEIGLVVAFHRELGPLLGTATPSSQEDSVALEKTADTNMKCLRLALFPCPDKVVHLQEQQELQQQVLLLARCLPAIRTSLLDIAMPSRKESVSSGTNADIDTRSIPAPTTPISAPSSALIPMCSLRLAGPRVPLPQQAMEAFSRRRSLAVQRRDRRL